MQIVKELILGMLALEIHPVSPKTESLTTSDQEQPTDIPNKTNTVAEIVKYLDEKGIDHTGITKKDDLLDLLED